MKSALFLFSFAGEVSEAQIGRAARHSTAAGPASHLGEAIQS